MTYAISPVHTHENVNCKTFQAGRLIIAGTSSPDRDGKPRQWRLGLV